MCSSHLFKSAFSVQILLIINWWMRDLMQDSSGYWTRSLEKWTVRTVMGKWRKSCRPCRLYLHQSHHGGIVPILISPVVVSFFRIICCVGMLITSCRMRIQCMCKAFSCVGWFCHSKIWTCVTRVCNAPAKYMVVCTFLYDTPPLLKSEFGGRWSKTIPKFFLFVSLANT